MPIGAPRSQNLRYAVALLAISLACDIARTQKIEWAATSEQRGWWAYQPLKAVTPPQTKDSRWPRNEIDHFILAALETAGLSPALPADKRALIRRATFDLIGLPPTPEEVSAFARDNRWDWITLN